MAVKKIKVMISKATAAVEEGSSSSSNEPGDPPSNTPGLTPSPKQLLLKNTPTLH